MPVLVIVLSCWQLADCASVLVERYVSTLINEDYYYYDETVESTKSESESSGSESRVHKVSFIFQFKSEQI